MYLPASRYARMRPWTAASVLKVCAPTSPPGRTRMSAVALVGSVMLSGMILMPREQLVRGQWDVRVAGALRGKGLFEVHADGLDLEAGADEHFAVC
jgi:hypothetical protein